MWVIPFDADTQESASLSDELSHSGLSALALFVFLSPSESSLVIIDAASWLSCVRGWICERVINISDEFYPQSSRSRSNANVWRGIPDDLQCVLPFPRLTVHLTLIHLLKWALLSWKRPAALQAGLNWRVQCAVSEKPPTFMPIPAYTNANIHRANQLCPRTVLPLKF